MHLHIVALVGWLLLQLVGFVHPRASRVQWFAARYPGATMRPNVVVWHTTETGTWPGYAGGSTAPHFSIMVDAKRKVLLIRQHFPTTMSARALRNLSGGVETNTLNAIQVELIGTCTTAYRDRYGYFYWPDAPEWVLRELAAFMVSLHKAHPDYPLRDAAPRGWKPYPSSYANGAGQRMTFAEWRAAKGNVGHQHVPENVHGDPGNLRMDLMVAYALALLNPKAPEPTPPTNLVKPPTRVSKARGMLRDARKRALERGQSARAGKLTEALKAAPKR